MPEERKCSETNCSGNCEGCSHNSQNQSGIQTETLNKFSKIRNVIGVVSGKGGVGKSTVSSSLAVLLNRKGYKVGILDADITGPSVPKMFGINTRANNSDKGILPALTANGIKVMSINLLIEDPESPVIWRGPVIGGAVKQFWTDVYWGELDYLIIDMPPGTGDVPLTVFQSIPINGIVIVSSPQDLVSLIVKKAYNMAAMMNIPVLGLVENMSYLICPDCNRKINIFGESKAEEICNQLQIMLLGKMPIDSKISQLCDEGEFERNTADYLVAAADLIADTFK
ncbi:MAG: Mrp/NBP35 family ATP-binding protein [bacterium]|nr:Mrp/NBP35 family ATP-binding protein [bacterium]